AVALLVAAIGCGSSSSASAPSTANVAGTWSGTMTFTVSTGQAAQAVTMNLTQSGASVSGPWQTTGGTIPKSGNVGGTTTTSSFSGTFTINISNPSAGTSCSGTLPVSGTAGGT